jgi:4-hydroxybenzoate polyprenyltransferase
MLKKIVNLFVFSSVYIAGCAVLMVHQTSRLFLPEGALSLYYGFVFFATICSYNFHWWLSTHSATGSERLQWALHNKSVHFWLYLAGLAGSSYYFFALHGYWGWMGLGAMITFLYSAPKIPFPPFSRLKEIAFGKTIYLAMVWMYVTTVLPLVISGRPWTGAYTLFSVGRFFLIYAICILFDYRDREDDRRDGIRSMITYFNERGINFLFAISLGVFGASTLALFFSGVSAIDIGLMLVPGGVLAGLYGYAKKHYSDYLYYIVLDGLMMLSALLMLLLSI